MKVGSDGRLAVAAAGATLLTALALTPLVESPQWWFGAAFVVLPVMVVGIVLRQVAGSWPVALLGQLVTLVVLLDLLFARDRAFNPPAVFARLGELAGQGMEVSRQQAAPVDADPGILLLLIGGTGLIGLLVDLLAASLRQTAMAGLPLLALYCVPAALLPGGLPWYLFGLAALGFLVLLASDADDRVASWGRVLSSGGNRGGAGGAGAAGFDGMLGRGGRRAAVAAVVVALGIPALTPGLGDQLIGAGGIGGGEGGNGTIDRINPIVDLRRDLVSGEDNELLRYRTTVSSPQPLRIATADVFDGSIWAPGTPQIPRSNRVQGQLPTAPGLSASVPTEVASTNIRIGPLRETYLPLPYPATTVSIRGDWLYDAQTLNVIGDGITTERLQYTVQHLEVRPTSAQLAQATAGSSEVPPATLQLPGDLPTSIRAAATRVGGGGTAYQQAVRLQRFFRAGDFTYTTDAPRVNGSDSSAASIEAFLRVKRGYCVHFASAMAVMARSLNIPSRVAIGFLPGERAPGGDMVISAHDAHAWPELYFTGIGWVRFEPTPRSAGTTPPAWTQPTSDDLPEDSASTSAAEEEAPSESAAPSAAAPGQQTPAEQAALDQEGGFPWALLPLLLLAVALLGLPRSASWLADRQRWRGARSAPRSERARVMAEAAWAQLRAGLLDLGEPWARSWTPRAVQQRLITEHALAPEALAALQRLVADIEAARFAPPGAGQDRDENDRRKDVRAVLTAVRASIAAGGSEAGGSGAGGSSGGAGGSGGARRSGGSDGRATVLLRRLEAVRIGLFPPSGTAALRGWAEAAQRRLGRLMPGSSGRGDQGTAADGTTTDSDRPHERIGR